MAKNYHYFLQGIISAIICLLVIQVGLVIFADLAQAGPQPQSTEIDQGQKNWTKELCEKIWKSLSAKQGYSEGELNFNDFWDETGKKCYQPPAKITLSIGGIQYNASQGIAGYIIGLYKYAVGIGGILAVVVMMFGGMLWMTAGGSQERVTQGRNYIFGALIGLALLLGAHLILRTINTKLVEFEPLKIDVVKNIKLAHFGCSWVVGQTCPTGKFPVANKDYCGADTTDGKGICCCFQCIAPGGNCTFDDQCCHQGDPGPTDGSPWNGPNNICHTYFNPDQCQPPSEVGKGCNRPEECVAGAMCDTAGLAVLGKAGGNNCIKVHSLLDTQSCDQSLACVSGCCCDISWDILHPLGGDDECISPNICVPGEWLLDVSVTNLVSGGINLFNKTNGCKNP